MDNPLVSVLILNYNGRTNLGEILTSCLSSVLKSEYSNFEVVLVDNGSTDGSVEFIEKKFKEKPGLKIVMNKDNYGFALGNNLGVRHTKGKYIVFINSDVEVESQWIKELVKVMEGDHSIGIAQSKVLAMDRLHIQTVGNLLDPALLTYLIGYNEEDKGQYKKVCEITFASGTAFIIRRALIEKIGLFDPKYFFYHDDCDLGWRARMAGFKIVAVPSSVVYHKGGGTSSHTFDKNQNLFLLLISRFGLFIKNYECKNVLKFGGLMIVSTLMDVFELLRQGDVRTFLKFAKWVVGDFRYNWEKRLEVQFQIRRVVDEKIMKYFLDSSILKLRLIRHFDRLVGGKFSKSFERLVSNITYNYYLSHVYNVNK